MDTSIELGEARFVGDLRSNIGDRTARVRFHSRFPERELGRGGREEREGRVSDGDVSSASLSHKQGGRVEVAPHR